MASMPPRFAGALDVLDVLRVLQRYAIKQLADKKCGCCAGSC